MRGLFFKIFAIFWIAQSLIFVISTALIVSQRFPTHNIVSDALDNNLFHNAAAALRAYQTGGCQTFADNAARNEPTGSALLDEHGTKVCQTAGSSAIPSLDHLPPRIDVREVSGRWAWLIPVAASDGTRYEYVWFQPPAQSRPPSRWHDFWRFAFPQLPVAIAVGGLTTFVLVLLFTRPLVRLRKAARQLAEGKLNVRVEASGNAGALRHSDEFEGLVHDFNHMAERLESLVGAQKLLLRDVSHELRSPLSRLSVALALAQEDGDPGRTEHLSRIEREADKLNLLIGQLLTLSSMEVRESIAAFSTISLNKLCEQILPDAEYEATQRPCALVLEHAEACSIRGDWELIYRAVENVVRNAIRYTDAGSRVTIRVLSIPFDGQPFAAIEVTDCGPGIPEADLAHIFKPFYRVDQARSSSTGGFGVGLAIAERAVRLHDGTVQASNRAGGGAIIRLLFPIEHIA
ncbi:two-component system sensor histidine kinase CpxA [Granulicella aggregans]|uniref:histidine kinase n=1 Tax=Granulicella aggregans TaxID=474949 RepID=A0A7W7ZF85_9BACT|nr:two-component system sensor histidine kinase CpxA [Granulicella aggregans]